MKNIGKYQVTEVIGKGAMGIVYKAVDPDINREVAIKTINFDLLSDDIDKDELIQRFVKEAQAAGKLAHPNIITIYDVVKEDNMTYIVMQYVEGHSLKKMIDDRTPLSPKQITTIIKRVGSALDYAHQNGIIHRDIKPANVLIDGRGNPFILDFGVARIETSNLTQTGTVVGTPSYMSPEQIKGKKVDNRSDIFSLGIILYELITGVRPFQGQNISTIVYKIVNEEPPELQELKKDVPDAYDRVIKKALDKDPRKRYHSCAQMVADLTGQKDPTESTMSMDLSDMDPAVHKRVKRRKIGLILAAVSCAAALIAVIVLVPVLKNKYSITSPNDKPGKVTMDPQTDPQGGNTSVGTPDPKQDLPPAKKKTPETPTQVNKMEELRTVFNNGNYARAITLAQEILADNPNNARAKDYLDQAQKQQEARQLTDRLNRLLDNGKTRFNQGDYAGCLAEMRKVLDLEEGHETAQEYINRVNSAITEARNQIGLIIERQRRAEETKDLLSLLSDVGGQTLSNQIRQDATILFNGYDNIQSRVSNPQIQVSRADRAAAAFDKLLTGVYKSTGETKVLFQGKINWTLRKQGNAWKITETK